MLQITYVTQAGTVLLTLPLPSVPDPGDTVILGRGQAPPDRYRVAQAPRTWTHALRGTAYDGLRDAASTEVRVLLIEAGEAGG